MAKNNKGFTLVDIICAMAILALVAMPICSGFMTAAKSHVRIREKTQIVNTLNNELSMIIATGEVDGVNLQSIKEESENTTTFTKALDELQISVTLKPKKAIADNSKIAYVEITLVYDDPETSDVTDDYKVSGVWIG